MAMIGGGGNFSDDPYARLIAMKMGSMSLDDLKKQEQVPQDAMDSASMATIGSIGKVGNGIKLIPSAEDAIAEKFAQQAKGAPSLFEKFGSIGKQVGGASTATDDALRAQQQLNRSQDFAQRNVDQIKEATLQKFQQLMEAIRNK